MEMKRLVVAKKTSIQRRKVFELWYLMKGYNIWHKDCECFEWETALSHAHRLESKCECFTEIREITKIEKIHAFYDYYPSEV